ncbi:haloacid dehalogenase [Aphanothece hegewaldii CCALA 016]|uniref:Haloacid dehalogenase n=1 Tax=Aphanothece hegewaldii CCALA 016 TaxID=2107694 RepID=A0A2T1M2L3_9CHRO|nr:haloacid dehalogenase [Aphanothece hegewaldii]PSF38972.1 haloacid dehalogenase [Aphanothece hegewaldii CCALA 016]
MSSSIPTILALDFDGVICDGILEYFQTTKRTYCKIWDLDNIESLDQFAELFYPLRPVIETGWEMPVLLRALVLGISSQEISQNWPRVAAKIVTTEKLDPKFLSYELDATRDQWIESNLDEWLALHRFYPGVVENLDKILHSPTQLYIISTKEGRFIQQLFQEKGVKIPNNTLFGKETKQPKYEIIRTILKKHSETSSHLWFVEDLLKTLQKVKQQPDLAETGLFLADWGYNTQQTRESIAGDPSINLLTLAQFTQPFSNWR